jgi:hypothetical protein
MQRCVRACSAREAQSVRRFTFLKLSHSLSELAEALGLHGVSIAATVEQDYPKELLDMVRA